MRDDGFSLKTRGHSVEESTPDFSILRIHGAPQDMTERLSAAFKTQWPTAPNTISGGVCRLSPREWAIIGRSPDDIDQRIAPSCGAALFHLAHYRGGKSCWRIAGDGAPDLLSRGAQLDFHRSAFRAGAAAQTLFANVDALVAKPGDESAFDVYVDAPYKDYMRTWLTVASRLAADGA